MHMQKNFAMSGPTKNPEFVRSLQYFEAVARLGSMKLAASYLGVTQSAVSHQLRRVSEMVGQQLLVKSGRGVALTAMGEKLASRLSSVFSDLDELIEDLRDSEQQTLKLAVCSSFAPGWLIRRLENFYDANPHISLQLELFADHPLISRRVADAYVVADATIPGFSTIHLVEELLVAVEAPRGRRAGPGKKALISTEIEAGKEGKDWIDYCRAAGLRRQDIQDGHFRLCSHYFLALEMARAGQGIALVPDFLAEQDLRTGTLVLFSEKKHPSGRNYKLCFKETRALEQRIKSLVKWFTKAVESEYESPTMDISRGSTRPTVRRAKAA